MKFLGDGLKIYQDKIDVMGKKFLLSGVYTGSHGKLSSKCLICEYEWESLPSNLVKNGCPYCNKKVRGTFESFKDKLCEQGRNIEIIPAEYKNKNSKFTFICKVCDHNWITTAGSLLYQESGCPVCALDTWLTLDIVQDRLTNLGKKIFVYGEYVSYQSKILCTCSDCGGEWEAKIPSLLCTGSGCPSCAKTGFDPNKPGYLYYLRITDPEGIYWKVGITNLSVKERFPVRDRNKITVLYCNRFENGNDAFQAEKNILNLYKGYRAIGLRVLKTGNTELFTKDVLQMDHLFWGPI